MSEAFKPAPEPMPRSEYVSGPARDRNEAERQEKADKRNANRPLLSKIRGKKYETKDIAAEEAEREKVIRETVEKAVTAIDVIEERHSNQVNALCTDLVGSLKNVLGRLNYDEERLILKHIQEMMDIELARRNKELYVNEETKLVTSFGGIGQGWHVPIERVVKDFREKPEEDKS